MSHVSTLDLHQLRYGELGPDRATRVRAHLDDCAQCRSRASAQQAMRREFEVLPVPPALRGAAARPRLWDWLRLPALAAAAAAAMLALRVAPGPAPGEELATRLKGEPAEVLVESAGVLGSGGRVEPGDRLQVRITPGPWREAWVTDGARVLGRFPVQPDEATLAPFSLTVDDAAGPERLVLVLAERAAAEDQVLRMLQGQPEPGLKKVELTFVKGR